jgi:hypothetical protein
LTYNKSKKYKQSQLLRVKFKNKFFNVLIVTTRSITLVNDDTDDFAKYSTRDKSVLPPQYAQADAETLNSTNTTIHAPVA